MVAAAVVTLRLMVPRTATRQVVVVVVRRPLPQQAALAVPTATTVATTPLRVEQVAAVVLVLLVATVPVLVALRVPAVSAWTYPPTSRHPTSVHSLAAAVVVATRTFRRALTLALAVLVAVGSVPNSTRMSGRSMAHPTQAVVVAVQATTIPVLMVGPVS